MHLWLLKRRDTETVGWDETRGVVVRANTEFGARELAATACGDEGLGTWRNASRTSCEVLTADGEPAVILIDFKAG